MKNAKQSSNQNSNRTAPQKEYGSYEEYLKAFLPPLDEVAVLDSEDPTEFGSELAELSLRKLEERLSRN